MRSTKRHSKRWSRDDIAQTAARHIAEGTAGTFAAAKRKAVLGLGADNLRKMPDNLEVQAALIEYLCIFEGDTYHRRIDLMRREALVAMQLFEEFKPRLVGPVLYGSACDHSPVTLHLYTDEFERVTRFLHEHRIDYQLGHVVLRTSAKMHEEFSMFLVTHDGLPFELIVLPDALFAHPPLSALDARPFKRADCKALAKLIDDCEALARDGDTVISERK